MDGRKGTLVQWEWVMAVFSGQGCMVVKQRERWTDRFDEGLIPFVEVSVVTRRRV